MNATSTESACDFLGLFGQGCHLMAILLVGRCHQQGPKVPERIHRQVNFEPRPLWPGQYPLASRSLASIESYGYRKIAAEGWGNPPLSYAKPLALVDH